MAADVITLVNDLISQQRWDEAYTALKNFAAQQPNDPGIEYQMGVLCFNMGRFADAEMHLKTSLSISPNPEAHYHLGLTLLKEDRPQEAMPEFREACERKQDFAVGHLHWGLALSAMGKLSGALGQFNQAIKLNPNMASAYYQGGTACFKQGQLAEAVQYFQKACACEPNLGEAYNGLGVTLAEMGNFQDAVSCFDKAWQVDNTLAVVQRNWASALVKMGQFDEAIKHYQESVGVTARVLSAKDRAMAYNDWAVNLFRVNRFDEAAEKLVYAVDVDPSLIDAHMNLGLVRSSMHEYELASEAFEKALNLFPEQQEITMQSAIIFLLLGRYPEALERLAQLQAKGFKGKDLSYWLGYANLALGNTEAALEYFEGALLQDSENFLAMDALGCCLALDDKHADAVPKFEQCITTNPGYALGRLHLARSLEALNQTEHANEEYKMALSLDPNCLSAEKEVIENLLKASQFDAAMSRSLKILEISPLDPEATLALAKVMKVQNRINEAQELIEKLIQGNPGNGPAQVLAGQIYLTQGRFLDADERFRMASELFDGDCPLYYSWGKSLILMGFHELALEKFQKASEIDPYDADVYDAWGAALKHLGKFGEAAEVFKRASEYM